MRLVFDISVLYNHILVFLNFPGCRGGAYVIRNGRVFLLGALICFLVFFGSVSIGAAGFGAVLNDVPEMLTLLVAVLLFVAAVLMLEAEENRSTGT